MNILGVQSGTRWTLAEFGQGDQQQRVLDLPNRTLIVGRASDADLNLPATGISKHHARLSFEQDQLIVEDLGSTNGTYVNGKRVSISAVVCGDLLQFANALYRVGRRDTPTSDGTIEEGVLPWAQTLLLFDQLISEKSVVPHFQPIIRLSDQFASGFELLARSQVEGLQNPAVMFGAAERLGQQAVLSELMREVGIERVHPSATPEESFFLNTHPDEVVTERLLDSLTSLRNSYPVINITIEIHEAAITDPQSMLRFQSFLSDLDMRLSYDDFGAGQGRLLELAEVPPDVLKFDRQLIQNIDSAGPKRQELLRLLVRMANEMGTTTLAEGVETEQEDKVCRQMGFELGQGFFYGRPTRWIR